MTDPDDPYSRVNYRRLVAWPERIEREAAFLKAVLARAPSNRILDLGCGTGEHARFLAAIGYDVTGVDTSAEMLAAAREGEAGPAFVLGDLADLAGLVDGRFGAAICLGNTLPHLTDRERLACFLDGLATRLLPGAPLLLQLLNYDRILAKSVRYLPLNFRPDEEGEIVFLRLMDPRPDGTVVFTPTTLRYRPGEEPPVTVVASRNVTLRGWRRAEVEAMLDAAGFRERALHGGMREEPFRAAESSDLVIVAVREPAPA